MSSKKLAMSWKLANSRAAANEQRSGGAEEQRR
jgi:hypothetical protein